MDFFQGYYFMIFVFVAGILLLAALGRNLNAANFIGHGLATVGCLAAMMCAGFVFFGGTQTMTLPLSLPFFGSVSIRVDELSAFFLAIIGLVGTATSIYAIAYGREYYGHRFKTMTGLYLAFLLSMVLVVTVGQIFAFLVVWEAMTVISFLLVGHDYERPSSTRAAYIYFVMTHVGTVFIIIAFLLLWKASGSMDFAALTAGDDPWIRDIIFLCALFGFGTKAGMVPLHIWLPEAHPAAPSHVSALMSGVMIKTAIYGLCRFYLEFLGAGPLWWGMVILLFGIVSTLR